MKEISWTLLAVIFSFVLSSCTVMAPPGGTVAISTGGLAAASGGVSFNSGSSDPNDRSQERRNRKREAASLSEIQNVSSYRRIYNPVFMFSEVAGYSIEYFRAGYVIFINDPQSDYDRSFSFCEAMKEKFSLKNSIVQAGDGGDDFPTIWPIRQGVDTVENCGEAVELYDYEMVVATISNLGHFPEGRGPLLVAINSSLMDKTAPPTEAIYWDLSEYEVKDFSEQVENWYDIVSFSKPGERLVVLDKLNTIEVLMQNSEAMGRVY